MAAECSDRVNPYGTVENTLKPFHRSGFCISEHIPWSHPPYLYTAYITTIQETLKSALSIAKTEGQKGNIQTAIDLCDKFSYETYITWCMASVKADIDAGIIAPPGGVAGNIATCIKEVYPSYGTIVITKENANIMDRPCSVNTDASAQLIESGALNAEYIVTGLYKNTADNYWYQLTTKNGQTGYIYSGNCSHSAYLSDVSATGLDVPTQIDVGSRYYIKGTISTVYTNLTNISFQVYDQNGNRRTGGTDDVTGKSYVLDNSAIDVAAEFNILEAGTYHCVLQATVENYSATECNRETVLLQTNELVVGNTGSSATTISTATITAKLNALKPKLNGKYWNYYSVCGVADNNVHNALKAVIDNGVLDKANPSNAEMAVTASPCTDYCRSNYFGGGWQCFGFAWWIEYYLFRSLPGTHPSEWTYYSGSSLNSITLQPGDYIRIDNGTIIHSAVVLDVSGGALQCVEAWGGVGCQINWSNAFYATGCYCYTVDAMMNALKTYGGYVYRNNNVSNGSVCAHNYSTTIVNANCTTSGSRTYTCLYCNQSYTESLPALGHDYQGIETAPTCSSAGFVTYTCSRCNDSYVENADDSWSEWSDVYPEGIHADLIQTRTEYRYQDKETTTSASGELPGWTLIGPTTIYGDYGAWGAWGDTPISASDNTKVETRTVWPYYYFLCGNCGAHMHGYGTCYTWAGGCGAATYDTGWREVWSTTSWDNAGLMDWYGTGKYYTHINGEVVFQLAGVSTKTQYRSCTREIVDGYSFYRWSDWSEWSDTPYTASEERNVEERTVYRYYTGTLGDHSWDEGTVTTEPTCAAEGESTHTCMLCGDIETRPIPVSDHHYISEVIGATCTEYSYVRYTCVDCGHSYEEYTDEDYALVNVGILEGNRTHENTFQTRKTVAGCSTAFYKLDTTLVDEFSIIEH